MLKHFIFIFFFLSFSKLLAKNLNEDTLHPQLSNSWGIRASNGLEFSHQRPLENNEQLEINTGLLSNHRRRDYDFIINGSYQWSFTLSELDELQWYTGPSVQGGYFDLSTNGSFNLGLGGQIGIAYLGNTPFLFSIDFRPAYFLFEGRKLELNMGFGIRYILR